MPDPPGGDLPYWIRLPRFRGTESGVIKCRLHRPVAAGDEDNPMAAFDGSAIAPHETRDQSAAQLPRSVRGPMDWDDVRVFLAVARQGSMRAAGRTLGLSQPTIARRLAAFEASFAGQTLFDRLPEGPRLNAAGEQLVAAAESVERAMLALATGSSSTAICAAPPACVR